MSGCVENYLIGENCTRQSNYILTGNFQEKFQIDQSGNGKHFEFNLAEKPNWECLGAGENVKYECLTLNEALKEVSVIGFLAAPVETCSDATTCKLNTGELSFKNFQILSSIGSSAKLVSYKSSRVLKTRLFEKWNPIILGDKVSLKSGQGLSVKIDEDPGYFRFGLSHHRKSIANATATSLPQHIYLSRENHHSGAIFLAQDEKVATIGKYNIGDTVAIYYVDGELIFTKNKEILHKSRCQECANNNVDFTPYYSVFHDYNINVMSLLL